MKPAKIISSLLLSCLLLSSCGSDKDKHSHSYDDWETVTKATCTTEGKKERFCDCGEKQTRKIALLDHTFNESGVCTICSATNSAQAPGANSQNNGQSKITYIEMDFGEYGKIVIEVNGKEAPITANNFMELVNSGFYDGLTIFRAQANFVIQGGKNESVKLDPIEGEFSSNGHKNSISHLRGAISMARTNDPDSATSQFFISLDDSATYSLDGKYAAFGRVVEGMSVVDAIANALMSCESDYMGFVSDADAVKIVSAKELKNYKK